MNIMRILPVAVSFALLVGLPGCTQQFLPQAQPKDSSHPHPSEDVPNNTAQRSTPAEQQPTPAQVEEIPNPNSTQHTPKIANFNTTANLTLSEQAQEISDVVTRIPGVERAAVLLTGKTALVGIDLADTISGSRIDTIKYSVKEAAERTGAGYHAIVSSDIDTISRTRDLINSVRAGKPMTGVSDELADIVSRLLPEM